MMSTEFYIPTRNQNIFVVSSIQNSFPPDTQNIHDDKKTSVLYAETERDLRKALYKVTQLPNTISIILGINLFRHDSISGEVSFSLWSLPTLFSIIRIPFVITVLYSYIRYRELFRTIFGSWGATEEFSHGLAISSVIVCDTVCALFTIKDVKFIEKSHNQLFKFVVDITVEAHSQSGACSTHIGPSQYLAKLKEWQDWIEKMVYIIITLFIIAYLVALKHSFDSAMTLPEAKDDTFLLIILALLIFYFIGIRILRQTVYYSPIGSITLLCFGISVLKDSVEREISGCKKLSQFEIEKNVNQLLEHFRTVYQLVEDINLGHQWILITGVVSLLIIIICASFQFCICLQDFEVSTILIQPTLTLISNGLTFYCLCSVSSRVTEQAKECMVAMRDFIIDDTTTGKKGEEECEDLKMRNALKQKIRMWHMEGTMQPPSISPGYYFTLKRSIIPPV